jgi:hypothetical protein
MNDGGGKNNSSFFLLLKAAFATSHSGCFQGFDALQIAEMAPLPFIIKFIKVKG